MKHHSPPKTTKSKQANNNEVIRMYLLANIAGANRKSKRKNISNKFEGISASRKGLTNHV